MNTYSLRNVSALPEMVRLLFDEAARESFFNLPHWYSLLGECGLDTGSEVELAVSDDVRLAIACVRTAQRNVLTTCTNLYTPEFDLLGERVDSEAVRDFAEALASKAKSLDHVNFEGLNPASWYFKPLIEGLRAGGLVVKTYRGWRMWYESVHGVGFHQFVSSRPSLLRNTWRRKLASIERTGHAAFQYYRDASEIHHLIQVYEDVHARSWKSAEPYPLFIPRLIQLAAELGALRYGSLWIHGQPAAAQFWIVWRTRATIFKLAHVESLRSFSPGTLLTMEMMRRVLEEDRPCEINFGRGNDEYKKLWLSSRRERWGIEAGNPRRLLGLAHSARIAAARVRDRVKKNTLPSQDLIKNSNLAG